jgi:8-oxo-dGTP pyrophosphatase MutT (NUDIX family)
LALDRHPGLCQRCRPDGGGRFSLVSTDEVRPRRRNPGAGRRVRRPWRAAAQRELLEETGCTSDDWIEIGHYLVDPNRGIATGHFYLARGVRQTAALTPDDLEEQELVHLSRAALEAALDRGEFKVLAWAAAVALALRRMD